MIRFIGGCTFAVALLRQGPAVRALVDTQVDVIYIVEGVVGRQLMGKIVGKIQNQ